jgi:AcrR family transcriptional regulator
MEEDRRTRKKDRTRQALLGGALALFAERGIYEPSIEEITARADVGKGTFYQYFDSREVLIAELVQNGFTLLLAEVALQLENAGETADPFPIILVSHQYFFALHPEYLLLFHQARGWMKMARHHGDPLKQAFAAYVSRLGELMGDPPAASAGPPSRRAVILAGFIAGVLSFEKILGVEGSASGLVGDLELLAPGPPSHPPAFAQRPSPDGSKVGSRGRGAKG